jgi:hypothetical protein
MSILKQLKLEEANAFCSFSSLIRTIRFRTHPVVDGKGCDLQRHGDHVDSAVQQVGLKFLLQVDLLRPRKISQEVKTRSLDKKYSLPTEKNILVFSKNAGIP